MAVTASEALEASDSGADAQTFSSDEEVRKLERGSSTLQALQVCIEKGYISTKSLCFLNSAINHFIIMLTVKKIENIITAIKRVSGGATCCVEGVSGSICASGIVKTFNCIPG